MTDYELMKLCVRFDFGCSNVTAKSVLCALASWYVEGASGKGCAWRPVRKLAVDASCDRNSISPAIKWLEEKQIIKTIKTPGKATYYTFNLELLASGSLQPCRDPIPVWDSMPEDVKKGGKPIRDSLPVPCRNPRPLPIRDSIPEPCRDSIPKKNQEKELEKELEKRPAVQEPIAWVTLDAYKGQMNKWIRHLVSMAPAKLVAARKFPDGRGGIDYQRFASELYANEDVFKEFEPWLMVLRDMGRI